MKVLVTGAAGFLGKPVVRQLLDQGHQLFAMVRPAAAPDALEPHERMTIVRGDLRQDGPWNDAARNVDAIVHLAAGTSGGFADQFAASVVATEKLLAASATGQVRHFIHVSSFSVYDYSAARSNSRLDEKSALEPQPEKRDAYTWTKLIQERMVREHCERHSIALTIVRPGAIYGDDKTWSYGSAIGIGGVDLVFSPFARMKLIHVENCAAAIGGALESSGDRLRIFNLIDPDSPTHWGFHRLARRSGQSLPVPIPVPWLVVAAIGLAARIANRMLFGGRARLPEILDYRRQQARWKPFRYSISGSDLLGNTRRLSLREGVRRMVHCKPQEKLEAGTHPQQAAGEKA